MLFFSSWKLSCSLKTRTVLGNEVKSEAVCFLIIENRPIRVWWQHLLSFYQRGWTLSRSRRGTASLGSQLAGGTPVSRCGSLSRTGSLRTSWTRGLSGFPTFCRKPSPAVNTHKKHSTGQFWCKKMQLDVNRSLYEFNGNLLKKNN